MGSTVDEMRMGDLALWAARVSGWRWMGQVSIASTQRRDEQRGGRVDGSGADWRGSVCG